VGYFRLSLTGRKTRLKRAGENLATVTTP